MPPRAVFDAARKAPALREAVTILDMALSARILSKSALVAYLATREGWSGVRMVAAALEFAEDRVMSPYESAFRMIWCLDAALPRPRCNWPTATPAGVLIGRPDLLGAEHAIVGEFDGARHRSREQHREDHRRDDAFRSAGLEPVRVVGADLRDTALVVARIRAAIDRAARSGTPRTWRLLANPRPVT